MRIEFHTKDIVISEEQRALIEKKLAKLKRFLHEEPLTIDVYLTDESSPEKGGIDQVIELSATFRDKKIFIREIDDKLMRAFAFAYRAFERQLSRFHRRIINKSHEGQERALTKILRRLRLRK